MDGNCIRKKSTEGRKLYIDVKDNGMHNPLPFILYFWFLYEWKSKTRKKARVNRENILQTGGGGYKCTDLNELENRLMSIYGWVHIVRCPGAPDEVDPDNNGKSRTPTPELPTREILLEYDNNDEIIHIELEAGEIVQ
ncbi:hypothetical protein JTB14_012892 [Gonioctena quinquepunctata]|nr:hypothetical protein JTB14_012892 [Gonioctena quinquepunctata]